MMIAMSLADLITIAGCIVIAVGVLSLVFLHFLRLENVYQAKDDAARKEEHRKHNAYVRYCVLAIIAGLLIAVWH